MQLVLSNFLIASPSLAALIGNRAFWDELPQGLDNPAIVMFLISSVPGYTHQGADGLTSDRVQFDCRGRTADEARQVAAALDARLSGFRGTFEGVRFQGAFKQGHRTRSDKVEAIRWFTASVDYIIWSAAA